MAPPFLDKKNHEEDLDEIDKAIESAIPQELERLEEHQGS